ncbi:MAG TPA: hypothetical protein VFF06_32570 [Polyangia bacterium]|nr:hypothetical protein [Polyangia bacterium]
MVKPIARGARSFRGLFWLVVALGVLPSLVSGAALAASYHAATLCAAARPIDGAAELAWRLRWERVHAFGRWGALVAGLLVIGYGAAWAYESRAARRARKTIVILLAGGLLPSLVVATWSGRAVPWRLLAPLTWPGARAEAPGALVGDSPEEAGGPAYCEQHPREAGDVRLAYLAHVGGGMLALLLTLGLADFAARWRRARDGNG